MPASSHASSTTPGLAASTLTDPALLSSLPFSKRLDSSAPGGRAGCPTACLGLRKRGGSGRPPAGARAPESHTAITLANSPRASHASSPQDRPTPRIAPNPRPSWTLHSPPLGREEDGGTGEEANREPFCYSHLPITQGLGEGGPWKHQILPLGVNSSLHPLSLFPELLKATAWGKPVHTVFSLT